MASDEVTKLKADLNELNVKCQLARDNEVRFALQRGRLEAERFALLVKMMETMVVVVPAPPVTPAKLPVSKAKNKYKPDGLPTYQRMVQMVLDHAAPKWLAPRQITARIQQTWWPDIPPHKAAATAWGMARANLVETKNSKYRSKQPNGYTQEASTAIGNGTSR